MKRKYLVIGAVSTLAIVVIFLSAVLVKHSQTPEAIADFFENSDVSVPPLAEKLYKAGLIKNVVALNTVLVAENAHALFLKGIGQGEEAQNLANPLVRYVKVTEGLRKEEIANKVGKALAWNDEEKQQFAYVAAVDEGKLYPETYILPDSIKPIDFKERMVTRFNQKVTAKSKTLLKNSINLSTAVKIGSIIQREAAGKQDMNLISGIIWNRLFKGMSLDIDATLQYAKGNEEDGWWPRVVSKDKYIDSPFNTYENKGLPPTPISNPGLAAITAAINPTKTDCLFYLHDKKRVIHCSVTYAEHVKKIKKYL